MKNMRKIWMCIATVLVVVGCSVFALTMTACSWNFNKLSTQKNETNTYTVAEEFNNISIHTDTADIFFLPSNDGERKVVCQEFEKEKHSVSVVNGTLTIQAVNEREWYDYIGITLGKVEVRVYLPQTEYQSLVVREDTGDIEMRGFTFESIDMELSTGDVVLTDVTCTSELKICVTTGDVELNNVACKKLFAEGDTGDISLENVSAEESVTIERTTGDAELDAVVSKSLSLTSSTGEVSMEDVVISESISIRTDTGDVEFEVCDAPQIVIKTDTGDVKGSLLTGKEFITNSDTGKIRVPENSAGGRCEITTDTGDIRITIGR